jgi:hypothetical protein
VSWTADRARNSNACTTTRAQQKVHVRAYKGMRIGHLLTEDPTLTITEVSDISVNQSLGDFSVSHQVTYTLNVSLWKAG